MIFGIVADSKIQSVTLSLWTQCGFVWFRSPKTSILVVSKRNNILMYKYASMSIIAHQSIKLLYKYTNVGVKNETNQLGQDHGQ